MTGEARGRGPGEPGEGGRPADPQESARGAQPADPQERGELVYDLYQRGSRLLEAGDFRAAAVPLERARLLEPDKTSIREALGRAYFRSGRFGPAAEEFEAVVERAPVNDFAHFCLGKALVKVGRPDRARHHAALAACMRPDRADYRALRERLRAA